MALFKKRAGKILDDLNLSLSEPPLGTCSQLFSLLQGVSPEPYWKNRPSGAMREIFFQTTMDKVPHFLKTFAQLSGGAGIPKDIIAVYLQPQIGGRICHVEFIINFDPTDSTRAKTVNDFADNCAAPLIKAGAYFSRPYGSWTAPAMDAARSSRAVCKKVKAIFDPDGILSPGRLGL